MDKLVYNPVELNYMETLAKTFINPAWKNQFFLETNFNNAQFRRIAIAMNTKLAFTGSYIENQFWYRQFDLRFIKILRVGQPIVRCSWKKASNMDNGFHQQIFKLISLLKYRHRGFFPSDHAPTLDNYTFAIINAQPSNIQGEHWLMMANSRQTLYIADSLARPSFLKQQYKQIMPEPL